MAEALVIDCHAHIYPIYDERIFFEAAIRNLSLIAPNASKAILLAERSDCDRFETLLQRQKLPSGFSFEEIDDISMRVRSDASGGEILLVAGRQIATRERLEVLALGTRNKFDDGCSFQASLEAASESGGIVALTWAPGKWSGRRGAVVRAAISEKTCDALALCDTTLRPVGWPTPPQFRLAESLHLPILAGTDPLPMRGEEEQVGRYGIKLDSFLEPYSGRAVLSRLKKGGGNQAFCGERNGAFPWLYRYIRFMSKA